MQNGKFLGKEGEIVQMVSSLERKGRLFTTVLFSRINA
jgi:hypothetical protein